MTFPAREQFDRDQGTPLTRVYRYCCDRLDFHQVREVKKLEVVLGARVKDANVKRLLNTLVARGYLIEHARPHATAPRRFTLAHSVELVAPVTPRKSA